MSTLGVATTALRNDVFNENVSFYKKRNIICTSGGLISDHNAASRVLKTGIGRAPANRWSFTSFPNVSREAPAAEYGSAEHARKSHTGEQLIYLIAPLNGAGWVAIRILIGRCGVNRRASQL